MWRYNILFQYIWVSLVLLYKEWNTWTSIINILLLSTCFFLSVFILVGVWKPTELTFNKQWFLLCEYPTELSLLFSSKKSVFFLKYSYLFSLNIYVYYIITHLNIDSQSSMEIQYIIDAVFSKLMEWQKMNHWLVYLNLSFHFLYYTKEKQIMRKLV